MKNAYNIKEVDPELILGYYRLHQILSLLPISASSWFAGVKSGRFPKPVKFGSRAAYWSRKEIHALFFSIIQGELR